jgi:uncharacterized surface protein with fasciclin (FAS1) repeats
MTKTHKTIAILPALAAAALLASPAPAQCGGWKKSDSQASTCSPSKQKKDIVTVAREAGDFGTLLSLVEKAGLTGALQGDGPLTVFAPNNAAFAKLPKETVALLQKPEGRELLTDILKYHVVSGRVDARTALAAGEAATLAGQKVMITLQDGKVKIGEAGLVAQDIAADNGLIHVIDSVLIPTRETETQEQAMRFPQVSGSSLAGVHHDLPADFGGDVNLVLVAFKRHQQAHVDTWMPFARQLATRYPGLRVYELPVLDQGWKLMQGWIDGGMRSGVRDPHARAHTITLYIDKQVIREPLAIDSENTIYAFLVDRHGNVHWKAEGAFEAAHGQQLSGFLAARQGDSGSPEYVRSSSAGNGDS